MVLSNSSKKLLQIDKYKVDSQLNVSEFGTVYKVHLESDPSRRYALKLLHTTFDTKRLQKLIDVLARLNKSDLFLQTYTSKKVLHGFFFLFELADSFNRDIESLESTLTEASACKVLLDIVNSLEFLQKNKIIHGNIRPENILQKNGKYYLIDYEAVKRGSHFKTLDIPVDNDIIASETYKGFQEYTSDIYSLGCSVYFMLTGEHVYGLKEDDTFSRKMFAHLYQNVTPNKKISKKMFYLISRMVMKKPEQRASLNEIRMIVNNEEVSMQNIKNNITADFFDSEFTRYKYMAEDGISYAQNILGLMYEEGNGVEKNLKSACKWYKAAAEQGLAKAQFNLALCYKMGKGYKVNYQKSRKYFKEAIEQEHHRSFYQLGEMYEVGLGVKQNIKKAKELYKEASLHGYKPAYKKLEKL